MTKRRFEGKSLDEAIANAAREFGVETYQLAYHIAVQKRGFLGGTKRVVIEAEPSTGFDEPEAEKSTGTEKAESPKPVVERPKADRTSKPKRERSSGRRGNRKRQGPGRKREESAAEESVPEMSLEVPEQGERSEEENVVAEWCERVASLAGFELVVRTSEDNEEISVSLYGADYKKLMARGGELLDSLQVLANKSFVGRKVEKRIEFDVGSFKKQREDELGEKARSMAEVARREGTEQVLPSMTPIERRIVHIALRDDESVETVSRGNGFMKRVAIVPLGEPAASD